MWEHLGGLPCQTPAKSAVCLGRLTCYRSVTLVVTNSEYFRRLFGAENGIRSTNASTRFFGGKRANLEARAAHLTPDTKNALFGVRRFQRFLLQKRSGDEAVTSLVTSVFWTKFSCFGAFLSQKTKINWSL